MLRKSSVIRGPLRLIFAACVTAAALFNSAACAGGQTPGASKQEEAKPPAATPARIGAAELAKLRWIEGAWRGTGDVEKPFYERYRFENDSTLAVESFPD